MRSKASIARWTSAAAVVAALLAVSMISSPSPAAATNLLVLRVVADPTLLDLVPTAHGGPFYIPGEIFDPRTGATIGVFHCWGFFYNGGAVGVVAQEYELFGRGKIQVQGVEDEGPRAVTGGTGDFVNVRGEMVGADLSKFPDFTVSFWLLGARGGR